MQFPRQIDLKNRASRLMALHQTAAAYGVRHVPFLKGKSSVIGAYLLMLGIICSIAHILLMHYAQAAFTNWTPGFRSPTPAYNAKLIDYALAILSLIAAVGCGLVLDHFPKWQAWLLTTMNKMAGLICLAALVCACIMRQRFSTECFLVASVILFPELYKFLAQGGASAEAMGLARCGAHIQKHKFFFLMLPLLLACGLGLHAWYPVQIANDFMQFPESFADANNFLALPSTSHEPVSKDQVAECLLAYNQQVLSDPAAPHIEINRDIVDYMQEAAQQHDMPESIISSLVIAHNPRLSTPPAHCSLPNISWPKINQLYPVLQTMNSWQAETGRLYYHHSYIYVPAAHLLRYGLSSPFPYLYGLGNTAFYALMMRLTSVTLTSYMQTFPIAQGIGILALLLMVGYATRRSMAVYAAAAAILLFIFRSTFEAIQLAPGFNPLRYVGLVAQTVSVIALLRTTGSPIRGVGMLLALTFSLVWNSEFALFGFISQGLAFLSPRLQLSLARRCAWLFAAIIIVLSAQYGLGKLNQGYLHTVQSGLFGIGLPTFTTVAIFVFIGTMLMIASIAYYGLQHLDPKEKASRWVLFPVLGLVMIKYLYTPSLIHLYFALMFVAPLLICYLPWQKGAKTSKITTGNFAAAGVAGLVVLCLLQAMLYSWIGQQRTRDMIEPFVTNSWASLGESFVATTPAVAVESRMAAIKADLRANDRVLFLSPMDYLMSFYTNPKKFCGHFEITSNLPRYEDVAQVMACVRNDPHALVVYDEAVEASCPNWGMTNYHDMDICAHKHMRMMALKSIIDELRPELVLEKKVGDLSFYRHATP